MVHIVLAGTPLSVIHLKLRRRYHLGGLCQDAMNDRREGRYMEGDGDEPKEGGWADLAWNVIVFSRAIY